MRCFAEQSRYAQNKTRGGNLMNPKTTLILSAVFALCLTVAAYVFVIPEKRRPMLPKFFQIVHDIFNFKQLFLETILKAMYVLSTLFVILFGFFTLFGYDLGYYHESTFGQGLLIMLLGPIMVRIVYELSMMTILLVKNVIDINKKLSGKAPEEEKPSFGAPSGQWIPTPPQPPVPPQPPQPPVGPNYTYCGNCGTRYDKNQGPCPICHR